MARRAAAMALVLAVLAPDLPSAWAADVWSRPFPGVRRLHRSTDAQNINVLVVDLCAPGVSLRATASAERRRTVSAFGQLVGAEAAINGDFFTPAYSTDGLAMSGGAPWPGTADHSYVAPVAIGSGRVQIDHHQKMTAVEPWMKEIVSGHPTLLDDGKLVGSPGDPLCTNRHPRTAVAVSADRRTLVLAVVDGRAPGRLGMTCPELAALLAEHGGFDGVNLDGGGSSAMWLAGAGAVSRSSDGSERVVGNHLAVRAKGTGPAPQCPCPAPCSPDAGATARDGPTPRDAVAPGDAPLLRDAVPSTEAPADGGSTDIARPAPPIGPSGEPEPDGATAGSAGGWSCTAASVHPRAGAAELGVLLALLFGLARVRRRPTSRTAGQIPGARERRLVAVLADDGD